MNKTMKVLTGVLAAQLAVAGLIYFKQSSSGDVTKPLLGLTSEDFDRVVISEPDKPAVQLSKKDGKWILPDRWNFPVSSTKWAAAMDGLLALKKTWPVGDTAAARKRCKVTEDLFEKKVVFEKGGKEKQVLYLGTSPEYRKVHFRPAELDGVYLAEFGYHDLAMNPADWEDKTFLSLDRNALFNIETPSVQVVNKENGFQVNPLKAGETSKTTEVDAFVSQVVTMPYLESVGPDLLPDYGLDNPDFTMTVRTK
ncbi:MAG: DUF4340 domain-containing protein, partial [Elusimicrobia bacterium]|nr:DUF4340 domain-containing protein [Elusimicrobiota bacterium]